MKLLPEIEVSGKRVFLRADLDVDTEELAEAARLRNLKPTVDYLISKNVKRIVLAGHIGRPEGRDEKLSTKNLVPALEETLGQAIEFSEQLNISNQQAKIVLLENLRFWEGEEKNDLEFAKELAELADIYVNDAFGVSHRAHASTVGVPAILPHAAGLHLEEEIEQLTRVTKNPERPMATIIGGAKLETKIPVIEAMAKVADLVLVGGLIAKQLTVDGSALLENPKVKVATLTEDTKDISSESIEDFEGLIKGVKTVVWNGPVGYFEGGFEKGTLAIAQAVINSGAYSVIGGGETTEFLGKKGLLSKFGFVSSGGGAMLEFLAGNELPGVVALK